jgi:hypothetical protein
LTMIRWGRGERSGRRLGAGGSGAPSGDHSASSAGASIESGSAVSKNCGLLVAIVWVAKVERVTALTGALTRQRLDQPFDDRVRFPAHLIVGRILDRMRHENAADFRQSERARLRLGRIYEG